MQRRSTTKKRIEEAQRRSALKKHNEEAQKDLVSPKN